MGSLTTGLAYSDTIQALGLSEDIVQEFVNLPNVIEDKNPLYKRGKSSVHGIGLFATKDIKSGDTIGPMNFNGGRTNLGRFTNHSESPNCTVLNDVYNTVVANINIKAGEEIFVDYGHALSKVNALVSTLKSDDISTIVTILNEQEQTDLNLKHYLINNIYAREITIPAGTLIVGARHIGDYIETMSQGTLMVAIDGDLKILKAPFTRAAFEGKQKLAYAFEDSIWTTYHQVKANTVEEAEAETINNEDLITVRSNEKKSKVGGLECQQQ